MILRRFSIFDRLWDAAYLAILAIATAFLFQTKWLEVFSIDESPSPNTPNLTAMTTKKIRLVLQGLRLF
jgi:hypothetical protein